MPSQYSIYDTIVLYTSAKKSPKKARREPSRYLDRH
jgi:hypothetical protein